MSNDIGQTWLWRNAFVEPKGDCSTTEQTFFRQHLVDLRERVKPLAARIMRDMPGYTVHDVTHLDALWEIASLVASEQLALNPPEAFVFGGAVLLHDAAMTLAAYPGGLSEIQKTPEWGDIMALRESNNDTAGVEKHRIEAEVMTEVLRSLHARQGGVLAFQGWQAPKSTSGERFYLIENSDLRHFYGRTIGIVAHSHW